MWDGRSVIWEADCQVHVRGVGDHDIDLGELVVESVSVGDEGVEVFEGGEKGLRL